jgi:hypothetical protein
VQEKNWFISFARPRPSPGDGLLDYVIERCGHPLEWARQHKLILINWKELTDEEVRLWTDSLADVGVGADA